MLFQLQSRLALAVVAAVSVVTAAPCDIYASGNTPCVAAHSTTRILYDSFTGALYQVQRDSDGTTTDIKPVSGIANAAAQDTFCTGTTCVISIIYDQSGSGNHLARAPPGGAAQGPNANGYDDLASAIGAPVVLNGAKAYGVFIAPGAGYRVDNTSKIATGDAAEGMYAVVDGSHYNNGCCFDYGNAETNNKDTGSSHMETLYFGLGTGYGTGAGSGPWVLTDMENGLYSDSKVDANSKNPTQTSSFVTAVLKGEANQWALRGGDSSSGSLSTYFSGVRPNGYNPMHKEGAIILGVGGDNSNWGQGTFYEGVMTSGYPSDSIENQVQANIVAAKYARGKLTSGPTITVGNHYSLQVTTANYTAYYLAHNGSATNIEVVSSSDSTSLRQQASWIARTGLGQNSCTSFESVDTAGSFLRQSNFALVLNANDGSKTFAEDATFCLQTPLSGKQNANSVRSWKYPTRFVRHWNYGGYIASNGGPQDFDMAYSFNDDTTFLFNAGLA